MESSPGCDGSVPRGLQVDLTSQGPQRRTDLIPGDIGGQVTPRESKTTPRAILTEAHSSEHVTNRIGIRCASGRLETATTPFRQTIAASASTPTD